MHTQPAPRPAPLLYTYTAARLDLPPVGGNHPTPNTTTSGTTCDEGFPR